MEPRLERYKQFIEKQFLSELTKNQEYSLEGLNQDMLKKIKFHQFKRIIFTGMGCSAIVSDVVKAFFVNQKIPISIEVVNDYDLKYLTDREMINSKETLIIISSYSGYSQEPIKAYNKIKRNNKNIIFLTSGGRLEQIAKKEKVSLVYWRLKNPDREYPLFHVPIYFSILLDVFYRLGILKSNFEKELKETAVYLKKEFSHKKIANAKKVANELKNHDIILLASSKWYLALLKLVKMHINEMSMAPAHRNYIHEFGHSEVAILSDPKIKHALLIFRDKHEDKYTKEKMNRIIKIFSEKIKQNKNITIIPIEINQKDFFKQFFSTLLFVEYISYFLGIKYNFKSRELISRSAGNPWYNIKTIKSENT